MLVVCTCEWVHLDTEPPRRGVCGGLLYATDMPVLECKGVRNQVQLPMFVRNVLPVIRRASITNMSRQYTYDATLRHIRATIVVVESNEYYTMCVCVCVCVVFIVTRTAHAPY